MAGTFTIAAASGVVTATPLPNADGIDLTHLPLGDTRLSDAPKVGWIWPCHIDPSAPAAPIVGPWVKSDGTYDLTTKAHVHGSVTWTQHQLDVKVEGDQRIITSNDLPDHPTGIFPAAIGDEARRYDPAPGKITAQSIRLQIPANPALAAKPSCVPGAVGVLLTGGSLYDALDAPGRDAVAHEMQDGCGGHVNQGGYHYHSLTPCVKDDPGADGHSGLLGYSVDGFGIFGRYGEDGKILTSADLDECHGHTHEIDWDGQRVVMYHYHATWDFPYTIGCMRGTYDMANVMAISGNPQGSPTGGLNPGPGQTGGQAVPGRPNLAAAAARLGISEQTLRDALGPPPPNLAAAAAKLGISEQALRDALNAP